MNPELLKYLPDEALAGAIKSPDGQIPGWLAVSVLAQRNSVRASAPQPAPQITVADDVVGQALRSGGIQSGIQSGPIQAPLRPAGGIMAGPSSQPVQHMASGGQVKASAQDVLGGLGLLPDIAPLDASKYQTKYEAPAQTSLDDARAAVKPIYGDSPDYAGSLAEIDKLKSRLKPSGLGDYLQNLGAGIAANAGTPLAAGNAMAFANDRARIKDQQNLEDAKQLIGLKTNIQNSQQGRQERIAGAIQQYKHVNDQIADNQARMKLEVAKGNAEEAAKIDTHNQGLQQKRSELLQDGIKDISNPIFAGAMLTAAKQKGDTAAQSFLQDAIATTNKQQLGQKQAESDIEEGRQMKVAAAQKQASLANTFAEKALEHKYKMIESGMLDENGKPSSGNGITLQGVDGKPVIAHPEFGSKEWSEPAAGLKGTDPNNRLDAAAVHWILTNEVPFKGQGAAMTNMAMQRRASEILATNNIKPEELTPIRAQYAANSKTLKDLTGKSQNLQMSEDRIDSQIPNLENAVKRNSYSNIPIVDAPVNWLASKFGGTGKVDRESAINPVVSEYANFMGGGNKGATDAAREHAMQLLPGDSNPKQAAAAAANLKREMEAQAGSGHHAVSAQSQRTRLSNIVGAIRSSNPDYGVNVPGFIEGGKRITADAGPKTGDVQKHEGHDYKFDGSKWVRQ